MPKVLWYDYFFYIVPNKKQIGSRNGKSGQAFVEIVQTHRKRNHGKPCAKGQIGGICRNKAKDYKTYANFKLRWGN